MAKQEVKSKSETFTYTDIQSISNLNCGNSIESGEKKKASMFHYHDNKDRLSPPPGAPSPPPLPPEFQRREPPGPPGPPEASSGTAESR